jgi:hygromycin-B 7''-O-kinase
VGEGDRGAPADAGVPLTLLPQPRDLADYARARQRSELWRPALRAICARHGLDADPLEPFLPTGTHVAFAAGRGHVVKLFARFWPRDFAVESACAGSVRDLGVEVPEIVASGEIEGWPYLVLRRLGGVRLDRAWPRLDASSRAAIAEDLGAFAARLHALPLRGLDALPRDWEGFVREQRGRCVERHRSHGASEAWLAALPGFLEGALGPTPGARRVFLHADLCDDNLLVREEGGHARLGAVLDFADARIGDPEYEFAGPSLFLASPDGALQHALLRVYGCAERDLDEALALRLTAWVLLHRYVHLSEVLTRLGSPAPRDPVALARRLWPFF